MQMVIQKTPVAHAQGRLTPRMGVFQGMEVALEFEGGASENVRKQTLGICDVSCFPRYGIKGINVLQWLAEQKISVPAQPNSWIQHESSTLVLRLGGSEFLIEDQLDGQICERLRAVRNDLPYGVFKVQRNDTALMLSGSEVNNLLAELCTLDLRDKAFDGNALMMTQVAGISTTILRQILHGDPVYRLWCDGTYGAYMWDTLMEIAKELGGGAVGLSCYFKEML